MNVFGRNKLKRNKKPSSEASASSSDQTTSAANPDPADRTTKESEIDDRRFLSKVRTAFKAAGQETIEKAFVLYFTLRDPATPTWCKSVIAGALAYFISFIDGIPDLTPVLGYTDDLSVMIAAISVLASHISDENKAKAKTKAQKIFA